jgi:hypothetical protein
VVEVLTGSDLSFSVDVQLAADGALPDIEFMTDAAVLLAPRYTVEVSEAAGEHMWSGAFFGGRDGADVLVCGPGPGTLVAIAGGVAYSVSVEAPRDYVALPMQPVREVLYSIGSGLVILVGYTSLAAVGADGAMQWRSGRLVSDGFLEVRLGSTTLTVRGWYAPVDHEVEITLDLDDGRVISRS